LIQGSDGKFYGTTVSGGTFGFGTAFKMDGAGTVTTLHSFDYWTEGGYPTGLIQASDGSFYGTTSAGGADVAGPFGTVFKMDAAGDADDAPQLQRQRRCGLGRSRDPGD
jgi:uncharacterized repeat protein (TIGR03803 family)